MRMVDTPEAREALQAGLNSLVATYGAVFSNTPTPSPDLRFELLWKLGYDLFHSLENWRLFGDATIYDDVQNKPYKGSDSVPF